MNPIEIKNSFWMQESDKKKGCKSSIEVWTDFFSDGLVRFVILWLSQRNGEGTEYTIIFFPSITERILLKAGLQMKVWKEYSHFIFNVNI